MPRGRKERSESHEKKKWSALEVPAGVVRGRDFLGDGATRFCCFLSGLPTPFRSSVARDTPSVLLGHSTGVSDRVAPPLGKPSTSCAAPKCLPRESVPRHEGSCQATHVAPAAIRGRRHATQTAWQGHARGSRPRRCTERDGAARQGVWMNDWTPRKDSLQWGVKKYLSRHMPR